MEKIYIYYAYDIHLKEAEIYFKSIKELNKDLLEPKYYITKFLPKGQIIVSFKKIPDAI